MGEYSDSGTQFLKLDKKERVVVKESLRLALKKDENYGFEEKPVKEILKSHLKSTIQEDRIEVSPWMAEMYKRIFQQYASALQDILKEENASEAMTEFFEQSFKSVVSKIQEETPHSTEII